MIRKPIPNVRVWRLGTEYLEAAEILLDYNRLQPAVILAALSIEIFLKSFLATPAAKDRVTTSWGHTLTGLFEKIDIEDRSEIIHCGKELNASEDFIEGLKKFDVIFKSARYRYEPSAPNSIGSDIIYFARHVSESVLLLGRRRGV